MKLFTIASLVTNACTVTAFPQFNKRSDFDPSKQCFNLTGGDHKFVSPGPNDIRGPCPGLNALANHNFLPHNGIASFDQLLEAQQAVFSIGNDTRHLLAAYGLSLSGSGDVNLMSIGGPPGDRASTIESLLRKTTGLGSEHVSFESDASPTREDLYIRDSITDVQQLNLDSFAQLYEMQDGECPGNANYDLDILRLHRAERVNDSVARNPDFFLSPFGALVNGAAHSVIFELMANHTNDNPDGVMDPFTLASMFAVEVCDDRSDKDHEHDEDDNWHYGWHKNSTSGSKSKRHDSCHRHANHGHPKCPKHGDDFKPAGTHGHKYKYQVGHERIPDLWCKRPEELTLEILNVQLVKDLKTYPTILAHMNGGNLHAPNSFKQVDISAYTSGVYPSYDFLLQGNNFACLGLYQAISDAKVPWLDRMYVNSSKAVQVVTDQVSLFVYLDCPTPKGPFDAKLFEEFPGWMRSQNWDEWLG